MSLPPAPARRLACIDTLRGVACLWVMLHHTLEHYPVADGPAHLPLRLLVRLADVGWLGVSLFLVLSGFCLYYPMVRRAPAAMLSVNLRDFAWRRAHRILPPYYAAIACSLLSMAVINHFRLHQPLATGMSGVDLLRHVLLVHNWWPESFASINGVFWSLALESQLYVLFPLFVWAAARHGFGPLLGTAFVIAVVWQTGVWHELGMSLEWTQQLATAYHALPARAFEFVAGMAAAELVAHPDARRTKLAAVATGVLLLPAVVYAGGIARFGPLLDQCWGVIFATVVLLLVRLPQEPFERSRVLGALTWLGGISYSVYLVHRRVFLHLPWRDTSDLMVLLSTGGRLAAGVAVGYLFYRLFEKPFIGGAGRGRGRVSTAAEPETGAAQAVGRASG